jgi:hypothetical protein
VLPIVNRMAKGFSNWLSPAFGAELELRPDLDQVEALAPEREALWTRLEAASFLTDDEKRAAAGYGTSLSALGDTPSSRRPPSAVKFNPYHDDAGRFTTADGGLTGPGHGLGGGFDKIGLGENAKQPSNSGTQVANSERRPGTRVPEGPGGGGGGFGSAGKQVVTPQGRGLTTHGEKRALERNFTLERVDAIIDNNRANRVGVVDSQGKKTWEYTDARGNKVVTNEAGGIVSVHSPATGGVYIEKP